MFQIWRFLSHARRGLTGDITVAPSCCGVIVTADSWLTMASRQAEQVIATATAMADAEGNIDEGDRCEIAFCPIDDVEYVLQHGTADSFLDACREVRSEEHTSELQSLMRISYAVFCLQKKNTKYNTLFAKTKRVQQTQ